MGRPAWLQSEWAGATVPVLVSVTLLGREFAMTGVLLTVALTLGTFSRSVPCTAPRSAAQPTRGTAT